MPDGGTPNPQALRRAPLPVPPPEAARAGELASAQAQDRFAEGQEGRPSPLELPQKSYAAQPTEAEEAKKEQERMAAAGEQFLGAPVVPTLAPRPGAAPAAEEEAGRKRPRRAGAAEEAEEGEEEDRVRSVKLEQERAQAERQRAQQVQAAAATQEKQQQVKAKVTKNVAAKKLRIRIAIWLASVLWPVCAWCCACVGIVLFIVIIAGVAIGLIKSLGQVIATG
jgi:hypothetical protein